MRITIIWIVGLVVAAAAGMTAMGAIAKDKAPVLAVTLSPMNGFAAENVAAASIKKSITENRGQFPDHLRPSAVQIARRAFLSEPITPEAVAILALGSDQDIQQRLMNIALSLSRRQPLVTGWMIADSGSRGDIPALLNHYDTTLRTSTSMASAVMPVLARALANDDSIAPFGNLLKTQPPWTSQFWATAIETPDSLRNAAILREALYKPNDSNESYRDADLIRGLVGHGHFEQALSLYRLLTGQKRTASLVQNASFETESVYSPLDWQLTSTGEYGAVINDGKLELSAIRNSGGLFARQLVKLPAQTLIMRVIPTTPIVDGAEMFINLSCAQTEKNMPQPVRIRLKDKISNLEINNKKSGCSFYWIDINGRTSDDSDGFDATLDSFDIISR